MQAACLCPLSERGSSSHRLLDRPIAHPRGLQTRPSISPCQGLPDGGAVNEAAAQNVIRGSEDAGVGPLRCWERPPLPCTARAGQAALLSLIPPSPPKWYSKWALNDNELNCSPGKRTDWQTRETERSLMLPRKQE